MKEIFRGAESKIFLLEGLKDNNEFIFNLDKKKLREILNEDVDNEIYFKYTEKFTILKARYRKNYRNYIIDKEFRKHRTRREVKIINKLKESINVPEIIFFDEDLGIIVMEYIEGERVSNILEKLNHENILYKIGEQVGIIHNNKIVHGDLTTSNILIKNEIIYLIDFGLSYFSARIEDFAVDLHLFKESFESRHWKICDSFKNFLEGYKRSNLNSERVIKKLEEIERRGRYKNII
ncbi:MAG: KEOPS complex kinase/ATPase Bud32 [Nanopusillaceae archaeon]